MNHTNLKKTSTAARARLPRTWPLLCLLLILLPAAGTTGAEAPRKPEARYEKEITAFETSDKTNPPPKNAILFIGSSSIRLWKTLAADFPDRQVINRGFGGSQIGDSIRHAGRIVIPYKPRLIVMYAGVNDINDGKSPEQVSDDFKTFVRNVHASLPTTRIAFIAISGNPARWAQIEKVRTANRLVEAFTRTDERLRFIDTHSEMLGPDGLPKPDIFVDDRLHMNAKGYKIWTRVIGPYLGETWPASKSND